jgi:hypothetical protein
MDNTWAVVRLNAIVFESALTTVEADPSEFVTTPRPRSSLFVPSKAARAFRKRIEPEIVEALHSMISMKKNRPRAQVALKKANNEFRQC